MASERRGTK
uniref:Uncharacterized protein n=1 Tax=Arundo donax TaxID=35708 RepID=A0A0A9CHF9_ARUDO